MRPAGKARRRSRITEIRRGGATQPAGMQRQPTGKLLLGRDTRGPMSSVKEPAGWIVSGVRTPFVKAGGALRQTPAYELGRVAIGELLAREEMDPERIDEVVLGNCAGPAEAANVARVTALRSGIPEPVPAATVHRNCASGMEAVASAV